MHHFWNACVHFKTPTLSLHYVTQKTQNSDPPRCFQSRNSIIAYNWEHNRSQFETVLELKIEYTMLVGSNPWLGFTMKTWICPCETLNSSVFLMVFTSTPQRSPFGIRGVNLSSNGDMNMAGWNPLYEPWQPLDQFARIEIDPTPWAGAQILLSWLWHHNPTFLHNPCRRSWLNLIQEPVYIILKPDYELAGRRRGLRDELSNSSRAATGVRFLFGYSARRITRQTNNRLAGEQTDGLFNITTDWRTDGQTDRGADRQTDR